MVELAILAAVAGVVWWKWDVIADWFASNMKDETDDDTM